MLTTLKPGYPQKILNRFRLSQEKRNILLRQFQLTILRIFCQKNKIINFGEELNDSLVEFLELSPDNDHLILLKKLQKGLYYCKYPLIIIFLGKNSRYYSYFGINKRTGVVHRK